MAMRQQIQGASTAMVATTSSSSSAVNNNGVVSPKPATPPDKLRSSNQQQSTLPSLCQVIAMTLSYRRLGVVWGTMPFLCVIVPMICKVVLFCLNSLTQGHGFVTVSLTCFLVFLWYQMIRMTAPNPKREREAYQKSQLRIPFVMFAVSHGFIQFMVRVAGEGYNGEAKPDSLQWTPTISWAVGIRPAVGLALIGAAVMMKFVGHNSVVRCSTMPLVCYHLTATTYPSDNAAPGVNDSSRMGHRSQYPSTLASTVLAILTLLIGGLVGQCIVVPYWQIFQPQRQDSNATNRQEYAIDFVCILTMVGHLFLNTLNWNSHELNPKRYYEYNKVSVQSMTLFFRKLSNVGITTVLVPTISLLLCYFDRDYQHYKMIFKELGMLCLFCVVSAASVGLYTVVIDETAKCVLCTPGSRLQRFVREVTCGRAPNSRGGRESSITFEQEEGYVVDVALHSLMHSDAELVAQVSKNTSAANPNYIELERYEAERNANAMEAVARTLLFPKKDRGEASLEEDILRHSILESLGGSKTISPLISSGVGSTTSALLVRKDYPADERHREAIHYWVQPASNTINLQRHNNARASAESKGVTLVRGLCAYSGGLGEALKNCSKPEMQSPYRSWTLPPGAVVAAEYAMVALARCIEQNLEYTKANAADWRSTHLSMFIPAALNSAYRLHCGVHEYSQYIIKRRYAWIKPMRDGGDISALDDNASTKQIRRETPELLEILRACDGCVKIIMQRLRSSEGSSHGIRVVENALEKGCAAWVQQVMAEE